MQKDKIPLGVQIDAGLNNCLSECAEAEKRTRRAVVELALEAYFESSAQYSDAFRRHKEEKQI